MKKIILISFIFTIAMTNISYGQSETGDDSTNGFTPSKGNFTASLLLGKGQYANYVYAPSTNLGSISNDQPNTGVISTNNNSLVNMVGAEARYFITKQISLKLSGGFVTSTTPQQQNIESVDNLTPEIRAVESNERVDLNFAIGSEYHFVNKTRKRMSPYLGVSIPIYYGKHSQFDPTVEESGGNVDIQDLYGTRTSVLLGFGIQSLAGIDYYINKDIYFGVQINPLGFSYTRVDKSSGAGFDTSKASTSDINILTQPVLKLGFRL